MKDFLLNFITFLFLLIIYSSSFGQSLTPSDSETSSIKPKTSYFKLDADYLTNNFYLGRADTILTPSYSPSLGYWHKSGLFINATANYLPTNKVGKLDNGSVELGYEFNFTDDFGGSISYSKLFYTASSTSLKSSISSTLTGSLNYNIADIMTPSLELDYNINKSGVPSDYLLNLGLAHDFIILLGEVDNITLTPTANYNLGTQNFYKDYLLRKFKSKKVQAKTTNAIDALAPFQSLDLEFSLPIVLTLGKFTTTLTPTDAIAVNKLPKGILTQYADKTNLFYGELLLSYKF